MKQTTKMTKSLLVGLLLVLASFIVAAEVSTQDHTASVELEPEYSQSGQSIDYNYTVTRTSGDPIQQVTIYKNPNYGSFSCEPETGWELVELNNIPQPGDGPFAGQATQACYWFVQANSTSGFDSNDSEMFKFTATTPTDLDPEESCQLRWNVQTVDSYPGSTTGQVQLSHDTTGIDDNAPVASSYIHETKEPYDGNVYILPGQTNVELRGNDEAGLACQSGIDYCEWSYTRTYVDEFGDVQTFESDTFTEDVDGAPATYAWNETFPVDSNHTVTVQCWDVAGHASNVDTVDFIVDGTAPVTKYTTTGPIKYGLWDNRNAVWFDGINTITFDATDNKFDRAGITTQYQHEYYPNSDYWYKCVEGDNELLVDRSTDDDGWTEYNKSFTLSGFNESCNVIRFKSYDKLRNTETEQFLRFFVDKTAPEMEKVVGEPKRAMCDYREHSVNGGTIMALKGYGGDLFDFTEDRDGFFGWNPFDVTVTTNTDGTVDFDLTMPRDLYTEPDNFDLVIDADGDGTPDFLVHYYVEMDAKDPDDSHWSFKENDGGWGSNVALPSWISASPDANGESDFTVTIDAEYLGGCGATFGFGVQAPLADEGSGFISGNGEAAVIFFPEDVGDLFGYTDNFEQVTLGNEMDWFVTTETDITLSCTDVGDHPSGDEIAYWRINRTEDGSSWTSSGWQSASAGTAFSFEETSLHSLEWYCQDAVKKNSTVDLEFFKVDDEAPVLTKVIVGPHMGDDCEAGTLDVPAHDDAEAECYLKGGETVINLSAEDYKENGARVHYSGLESCDVTVDWWNAEIEDYQEVFTGSFGADEIFQVPFTHDSTHILTVTCTDRIGNVMDDVEYFKVDMTPPSTDKVYGDPNVLIWDYELIYDAVALRYMWITSETPITLTATDGKVGVEKIYWRAFWVGDAVCEQYPLNGFSSGDVSNLNVVDTTVDGVGAQAQIVPPAYNLAEGDTVVFSIDQTSCHKIEYYAVDKFGHQEPVRVQHVMVDNEAPIGNKLVGEPKISIGESCDLPELGGLPSELAYSHEGLYWTWASPCSGGCSDIEPFALPGWRYATADEWANRPSVADMQNAGTCSASYFDPVYNQCDYSDAQSGYLTSEPNGDSWETWLVFDGAASDSCGDFYVTQDTLIELTCVDAQPHPVEGEMIGFKVSNNGADITETYCAELVAECSGEVCEAGVPMAVFDGEYCVVESSYYAFTFQEDSEHVLEWYCADELGNSEDMADQFYYVETVPPVTDLEITEPFFTNLDGVTWTDTETRFVLDAEDPIPHPSDVAATHYRWDLVGDDFCWGTEDGDADFTRWYVNGEIYSQGNPDGESSSGNEGQWQFIEDATTPLGEGSLELSIDNAGVAFRSLAHRGLRLADLTELSYWTYSENGNSFPTLQLEWDSDCDLSTDGYQGNLIYIPTDNTDVEGDSATAGQWQQWNVLEANGVWRTSQDLGTTFTTADALAAYPDACIRADFGRVGIKMGTEDTQETARVDGLNVNGVVYDMEPEGAFLLYEGEFAIPEESCHMIQYYSVDNLGNTETVNTEYVFVDKTAPELDIVFGTPFVDNASGTDYIGMTTEITVSAVDPEPHPSGLYFAKYRWTLVDNEYCAGTNESELVVPEGDGISSSGWLPMTEGTATFSIPEDSCHVIEVDAEDNVQKHSKMSTLIYVDGLAPTPNKTVGVPHILLPQDYEWIYYPEVDGTCNVEGGIDCWKVTTMTPIEMACEDQTPHPVGNEFVYFNVEWDADDLTAQYCQEYGVYNETSGYCKVYADAVSEFLFQETTEHKLSYYCEDKLGNSNVDDKDIEMFKVEEEAFEIELNKKWNLISVPFRLLNEDMEAVFDAHSDTIISVWGFNGTEWSVYTPDGVNNDDLNAMLPGYGYWVLTNDSDRLVIGGSLFSPAITPPSINVVPGWNLLGYFGTEGRTEYVGPELASGPYSIPGDAVECHMNSLQSSILNEDTVSVLSYWEPLNPKSWNTHDVDDWGLTLYDRMDPGAGYWVQAFDEAYYVPTSICGFAS